MTPIEKNVIVVDENGNEYEATYPKRAKGLVKNGRARFIDENTICLACPPKNELEDNTMSENIKNKATENKENTQTVVETSINTDNQLTAREIFEKIVELQKQLTESSYHSLHRLTDAISAICESTEESEEQSEQISEVCATFNAREETFTKMLKLYEKMYDDLKHEDDKHSKVNDLINTFLDPNTPAITKNYLKEVLQSYFKTP